jgi:hypothetical protein
MNIVFGLSILFLFLMVLLGLLCHPNSKYPRTMSYKEESKYDLLNKFHYDERN